MFVTGPDVVKTVTNEEVTSEVLGGARTHTRTCSRARTSAHTRTSLHGRTRTQADKHARTQTQNQKPQQEKQNQRNQ